MLYIYIPFTHYQYFFNHDTFSGQITAVAKHAGAGRAVLPSGVEIQKSVYTFRLIDLLIDVHTQNVLTAFLKMLELNFE